MRQTLAALLLVGTIFVPPMNVTVGATQQHSPFINQLMITALQARDYQLLNRDPTRTFFYVRKVVEVTEATDALFRMGQPGELMLDAKLGRIMDTKLVTNKRLLAAASSLGWQAVLQGGARFLEAREEAVKLGKVDPLSEMTSMMSGLVGALGPTGSIMADGEYDGKALSLMAQTDPAQFVEIYGAIRDYVYNGF